MTACHTGACHARADVARAQAAGAIVVEVLQGGRDSAVRAVEGHIAVVIGRVEPHQEREIALVAGVRIRGCRREFGAVVRVPVGQIGGHPLRIVVVVTIQAIVSHELHTRKVIVEDEVHHTRYRVRAVDR